MEYQAMDDPLQYLLYLERKADKKRVRASIVNGQVVIQVTLPPDRLLASIARIEEADTLPQKLRVIADELDT